MAYRHDIINHLIDKNGYKRYLEIGVRKGHCIKNIKCDHKDGVDPNPLKTTVSYKMTSDEFFQKIPLSQKYDIVFIDGLHTKEQVLKDISNSLNHLVDNGSIVLHDCNPKSEAMVSFKKCGTVWEAIVKFRSDREDLSICVVDEDYGCGVIQRGSQKLLKLPLNGKISYKFLDSDRDSILNLITYEKFKETY